MAECNCNKKTIRSDEEKKALTNHIKRISGSLDGIKKMIEDDRYCNDILIQLSAINSSIKSLSSKLLDYHLKHCVKEAISNDDLTVIDEVVELFKRFN